MAKARLPAYEFPLCMRLATLEERSRYYESEFDLEKLRNWDYFNRSFVYAIILGRYSHIFPREYARIYANTIVIDNYSDLEDFRDYILQYKPESVYYDRNVYKDRKVCSKCRFRYSSCWLCKGFLGQELAFDLDVENLYCPIHGDLNRRMSESDPVSFCEYELFSLRDRTIRLIDRLKSEFRKIEVTYSGRGFHIHILDDKAFRMRRKEREELAESIGDDYPIDEWVTEGESHLIRLPFSLNGLVSRIVIPLDIDDMGSFDPITDERCIPEFVKK
ncbi:MAG: DNA primase [Thermoplasmata archaeon]|nr:DNA primase [Thermoplasmata archaeon]